MGFCKHQALLWASLWLFTSLSLVSVDAQPMSVPEPAVPAVSSSGSAEAERFAARHEPELVAKLTRRLEVDTADVAVLEYARRAWPHLTSREAHDRHRRSLLGLATALEAVVEGEDPKQVFARSGFQEAGVDPLAWDFYAGHLATERFVGGLRRQARADYEEHLSTMIEKLRPIYVEEEIARRLCEQPVVADRVASYFAGLYPAAVEVPEPMPGEMRERCRVEGRAFVLDFARSELGADVDPPKGWARHLSLLRIWDVDVSAAARRPG